MFRKATMADLDQIEAIYERIHDSEEAGQATIGWVRGVYPTRATAQGAIQAGDLFVDEEEGKILSAARLNQEQVPEYADAAWEQAAPPERVMVLHALVVDPLVKGRGLGTQFVAFYEDYARQQGCPYLRMDTNARNQAARTLYGKLGYKEVGIVSCVFNGIPGVKLVCLEKTLV